MFGFKTRKAIAARARFLGELVPLLERNINSMSFEEFVEDNRRRGFVDSFIDVNARKYDFFEPLPASAAYSDLTFSVRYNEPPGSPQITVAGNHYYFGCDLNCVAGRLTVSLVTDTIPTVEIGRYARALYTALLKLPNVTTQESIMESLGG